MEDILIHTRSISSFFYKIYMKGGFELKTISELTGKEYEIEDVVWYGNLIQAAQYYLWGCKPVDMTVDMASRRWAFAFYKTDHKRFIERWNNQKELYQKT